MNRLVTKGLFFETAEDKINVHYTLKDWDNNGYPSLFLLYLEARDITEYTFATTYLDGLVHWEELTGCTWFRPYISRWRRELELKLKSEALRRIVQLSEAEGKDTLAASKFILSYGLPGSSKGRPSKEDIKRAAEEQASVSKQVQNDFDRLLNLSVN